MADPLEDVQFRRQQELAAIEAKIYASRQLIMQQEARIGQMREQGIDLRPSMHLLRQFQFSFRLLSETRDMIRKEIADDRSPGARVEVSVQAKTEQG
jgi:hypothetical protein